MEDGDCSIGKSGKDSTFVVTKMCGDELRNKSVDIHNTENCIRHFDSPKTLLPSCDCRMNVDAGRIGNKVRRKQPAYY